MDEPSSGVDPASRRKLWNIIRNVQKKGQSIILTSHSMEECDELCGRLGIMVNGQFQCFGPTRYYIFLVIYVLYKECSYNGIEIRE